jgi:glycosyltransferase involved in cell wall biosynthesis
MGEITISVVIPTRGRPTLLRRALLSAAAQTGPAAEIIVVDDGEGEGAAEAARLRLARLRTISSGGAGQVAARNRGVAAARGRAIAFLDDDDWWEAADHLARLAAALRPGGLAYASGRIVREDGAMHVQEALPFRAHADRLRQDNTLLVSGIAFDRGLAARIGPFDAGLPCYWDWDFYLRILAQGGAFTDGGGEGVRISVRPGTVSSEDQVAARKADLDRLCAKHGLTGITLKNHDVIAEEQLRARELPTRGGVGARNRSGE